MKNNHRSATALCSALLVTAAFAQTKTNTFPDSGSVGIGTTTPASKLNVEVQDGTSNVEERIGVWGTNKIARTWWYTGSWSYGAGVDTDNKFKLWSNINAPVARLSLDSSGNVGIGTQNPRAYLEIVSNSPATTANLMVTSGQDRTPRIRFNGPWSVSNSNESYAQIVAVNDNGGPGSSAASLHFFTSSGDPAVLSDKVVIAGSGNVGIGTTAPCARLDVQKASPNDVSYAYPNGTWSARIINRLDSSGENGLVVANRWAASSSTAFAVGNMFDDSGSGFRTYFRIDGIGNVGIGTTNPTSKLEVNGTIRTKEVIVETTGWSDYVFAPDYRLAPLSEVEAHIQAKGTLPGIPSAAEVAEHGVSVGDMQARMLAKIEELTLHQIALEKENAALKARVAILETNSAN